MSCGIRVRLHDVPPVLARDLARLSALWNDGLARHGGPYLAGAEFTAVDAFFAPVAFRIQSYAPPLEPAAAAYAARLLALPWMRTWYRDALQEGFRDDAHEADVAGFGTVIEDLRQ